MTESKKAKFVSFLKKQKSILSFNQRIFYSRLENISIKSCLKIIFILLALSYLTILTRIVLYGIPFELIELKNIILSTQSYFLRELAYPLIMMSLLFYATAKSVFKITIKEYFSLESIFLSIFITISVLEMFFDIKVTNNLFPLLLFISILIFLLDILINLKKYLTKIKIFLLVIIVLISYNLIKEGVYLTRYKTLNNSTYTHFEEDNVFSDIVFNYILEYKKPYIAKIRIDNKKPEEVLVLGYYNGFIYYYSKEEIISLIDKEEFSKIKNEKLCISNKELYYPEGIVLLLKTSVLRTKKFERKKLKRISFETEYNSFKNVFCKEEKI